MRQLNVRLLAGMHPIYETLLRYPPPGVKYATDISLADFETLRTYQAGHGLKRKLASKILNLFGLPRLWFVTNPCDMIHSSRGILILNRWPWIVDAEHAASFGDYTKASVRWWTQRLLASKYCKKILPHCDAARKSILSGYDCSKFQKKMTVVYPVITPCKKIASGNHVPRLLFVGKWVSFYSKGGKELLQAYARLIKKYDVELVFKTDAPTDFIKTNSQKGITFITETISRERLFKEVYLKSDIFVMPTFVDSFGYVFLEAMSAGLPVVGTDIFAVPEIIEDGKNGFLVHGPISDFGPDFLYRFPHVRVDYSKLKVPAVTDQLVDRLSILIEDSSLRKRMGRAGYRMVARGKFSIKERNKKLRRIYEEALRR